MPSIKRGSRRDPAAALAPKAAWGRSFEDFVGFSIVAETFAIDGRDEEYECVWDAPYSLQTFWQSPDGYCIHVVDDPDYQPETLLLLAPDGSECGFYSGGQLWIDEAHRGRGLGAEMVLAMTQALEASPTAYHGGYGFSNDGHVAHKVAWIRAVQRAHEAGLPVDPRRVQDAAAMMDELALSKAAEAPRPCGP